MEARIMVKHRQADRDALERDVAEFVQRGGTIEVLDMGAKSDGKATAAKHNERAAKARLFRKAKKAEKVGDEGEDE